MLVIRFYNKTNVLQKSNIYRTFKFNNKLESRKIQY